MATSAAKKTGARANSSKQRPAVQAVTDSPAELPKPEALAAQAKSPYPEGVRVYAYEPKDGSEPILLALNGFAQPDKLWHFDVSQLPVLSQTWKWMERANIPKAIQRQAQKLPDAEYFAMFDEWFSVMKSHRGALTAGK